ncbi:hypothetical protein BDW72DRAFT_73257 [Aspergillus terricola var. indicus]
MIAVNMSIIIHRKDCSNANPRAIHDVNASRGLAGFHQMPAETNGSNHAVGGRQSTKHPEHWLRDAAPHAGYIDPTITRPSALDTLPLLSSLFFLQFQVFGLLFGIFV